MLNGTGTSNNNSSTRLAVTHDEVLTASISGGVSNTNRQQGARMQQGGKLGSLLSASAIARPDHVAIVDPSRGRVTYQDLLETAQRIARTLSSHGIVAGDRVGILAPKSALVVAAIFGTLDADAAYVPVDPTAPLARASYIFSDCSVSAVVVDRTLFEDLRESLGASSCTEIDGIAIDGISGQSLVIARCKWPKAEMNEAARVPDGLAYILYTSGSTGVPKGVMHSHDTALSFVDWCSSEFSPTADDRFSSHAPFHFDLSIFDLYVAVKHGATIVLIGEDRGKQPLELSRLIAEYGISVWYSTPSILRLLTEFGKLSQHDGSTLRLVIYAGEVFPPKHQRALRQHWSHPLYYNLYGPTETNVCTYDRVDVVTEDDSTTILPIGRMCSGDRATVVDVEGRPVAEGVEGELLVAGGSVMLGYWGLPEQNARAFRFDPDGTRWYRTGDLVIDRGGGYYLFLGRRDRMVKRRGYRVELGEIEAALHRHDGISEAAVIAIPDAESGVLIHAFINWTGDGKPSVVELKSFSARNLPSYMVPDRFIVLPTLPKTSTDKIDYQRLKEHA
jgi:amino acid adenylation domain-containing protein